MNMDFKRLGEAARNAFAVLGALAILMPNFKNPFR